MSERMTMGKMWAIVVLLGVMLLGGCIPERVVWSPDGTQAAVLGSDGLHLCDAEGKMGPLLVPEAARVAWLPEAAGGAVGGEKNGKKELLVVYNGHYTRWADLSHDSIGGRYLAPEVVAKVKAALATPDWDHTISDVSVDDKIQALLYLRDNQESLSPAARTGLANWGDIQYDPPVCRLYELVDGALKPGPCLAIGPQEHVLELRVSPTGKYVLIAAVDYSEKNDKLPPKLFIGATHPTPDDDDLFLGGGNAFPDWSPDGNSIVYFHSLGSGAGDEAKIGTLCRQTVLDAQGNLLTRGKLPPREDLAGTLIDPLFRVRCAGDGRIFFTLVLVTLPASPNDIPSGASLFCIEPGKQMMVSRVIPHSVEEAIGDSVQFFNLSPDGKRIAIPFKDGRVCVFTVATGEVVAAQTSALNGDLQSVPTWRTATELTFVRPVAEKNDGPQGPERREVVRDDVAGEQHQTRAISATWDDAASKDWLKQVPSTQPTAFPVVR